MEILSVCIPTRVQQYEIADIIDQQQIKISISPYTEFKIDIVIQETHAPSESNVLKRDKIS